MIAPMARLAGKAALVTGAGSGIGRATALRFAEEGALVVAADVRGEAARATAAEIGGGAVGVELDVVSPASIRAGLDEVDGATAGIRVNCVCPGFTETPMIEGYFEAQPDPAEARAFATRLHPLGRLGRPRDIADAMVYLASDEAAWVTGAALAVDGGLTSGIWGG